MHPVLGNRRNDENEMIEVMLSRRLTPLDPYPGVDKPWRCKCGECGAIVSPRALEVRSSTREGGGCKRCADRINGLRRRTAEEDALKVMARARLTPLEPFPGGGRPWRARCDVCGETVAPRFQTIRAGASCRVCTDRASGMRRRLSEQEVSSTLELAGMVAAESYVGNGRPIRCRCVVCNRVTAVRLSNLRSGQKVACIWCAGQRVHEDDAVALFRARGFEPLEPFPGGGRRDWLCRCIRCGNDVELQFTSVKAGRGCRYCAHSGFKAHEAAWLYLIFHRQLDAAKIGVTNLNTRRIQNHASQGWELYERIEVPGLNALDLEEAVLRRWRLTLGLPQVLPREAMRYGGATETARLSALDLAGEWRRVLRLNSAASPRA